MWRNNFMLLTTQTVIFKILMRNRSFCREISWWLYERRQLKERKTTDFNVGPNKIILFRTQTFQLSTGSPGNRWEETVRKVLNVFKQRNMERLFYLSPQTTQKTPNKWIQTSHPQFDHCWDSIGVGMKQGHCNTHLWLNFHGRKYSEKYIER